MDAASLSTAWRRLGTQTDPAVAASAVAAWSASSGEVETGTLDVLQAARSAVPLGVITNAATRLCR